LKVVLNASPLIYLGKKRKTSLLRLVFEKILVPVEVEKEVLKPYDSPEAVQLRDAIQEGWIEVERSSEDKKRQIARLFGEIDDGEAAVIALALEGHRENVIIDDAEARTAAEYFELKVHGTLYIILEAYKCNIFKSKAEVISMVNNMLRKGFYISSEVYARLLFLLDKLR
jgi:predicted nucleic acid-binding protein